jgi:predicted transcriptional regulator
MKGYFIRQLLADKKVKVNDIAKDLGVSQVVVSRVIHGQTKSFRVKSAIAQAVNKPVSDLWPEEED